MIAGLLGRIGRTVDALRPPWFWQDVRQRQQLTAALRFWTDGGLTLWETLPASATRKAAELRVSIQPDGDVLLAVPTRFGREPGDEAAAVALLDRARAELAAVTRGPLPTGIAALLLLANLVLYLTGGIPLALAAWNLATKCDPGEVRWLGLTIAAVVLRWAVGRFARPRLVDWFLRKARAKIAAAVDG